MLLALLAGLALAAETPEPPELGEAIKYQRSGKPMTCSLMLNELLVAGTSPQLESKTHYYMARCLQDLQLHLPALAHFDEVLAQGPDDRYYAYALPKAIDARRGLGLPAIPQPLVLPSSSWPKMARDRVHLAAALQLRDKGESTEALAHLVNIPPRSDLYREALLWRGVIASELGDPTLALDALRRAQDPTPLVPPPAELQQAWKDEATWKGTPTTALPSRVAMAALEGIDQVPRASLDLAILHLAHEETKEAGQALERAAGSRTPLLGYMEAAVLASDCQRRKAREVLERHVADWRRDLGALDGRSPFPELEERWRLDEDLYWLGRDVERLEAERDALPESPTARDLAARLDVLVRTGQADIADRRAELAGIYETELTDVLRLATQLEDALDHRSCHPPLPPLPANGVMEVSNIEPKPLQPADEPTPNPPDPALLELARLDEARVLATAGDTDAALAAYQRLSDPRALTERARLQLESGALDEARAALEGAPEDEPGTAFLQVALVAARCDRGDATRAARALEAAWEADAPALASDYPLSADPQLRALRAERAELALEIERIAALNPKWQAALGHALAEQLSERAAELDALTLARTAEVRAMAEAEREAWRARLAELEASIEAGSCSPALPPLPAPEPPDLQLSALRESTDGSAPDGRWRTGP